MAIRRTARARNTAESNTAGYQQSLPYCTSPQRFPSDVTAQRSEIEHDPQRCINATRRVLSKTFHFGADRRAGLPSRGIDTSSRVLVLGVIATRGLDHLRRYRPTQPRLQSHQPAGDCPDSEHGNDDPERG